MKHVHVGLIFNCIDLGSFSTGKIRKYVIVSMVRPNGLNIAKLELAANDRKLLSACSA
jgi:hypothetical protein